MNATEDCILISDSEDDDAAAEEPSVLVVGEVPPSSKHQASADKSIVDLTSGNDQPCIVERESSESPLFTPPSSPESYSSAPTSQRPSHSASNSNLQSSSADSSLRQSDAPSQGGRVSRRKRLSPTCQNKRAPNTDLRQSPAKKRCSTKADGTPKNADKKQAREQAREQARKLKELQSVQRQADRANGIGKCLDNCTAIIDESVLKIVDPEGHTIRTLFDESSAQYQLADCCQHACSITWSYRRTEAKGLHLLETYKDADWMMIVMEGAEYLRRILLYRDEPEHSESIKRFICNTMSTSGVNLILLVYNLSKSLKEAKRQDERQFRQTFKNTYESNGPTTTTDANDNGTRKGPASGAKGGGAASIGLTDLQDLRLDLELEIKFENPSWKLQIDFEEKKEDAVAAIVRYTKAVAKFEIERRKTEQNDFDWAINADKERAIDPLKDLTKLWEKQLLQFGQLTTPIAKAITAQYPSPATLIEQYKHLTPEEGENLLAELHIGRLKKQVGPTISRRIYRFMTTGDPKVHLGID